MTCAELAEFLAEYLEGSLSADARAVFERHLAACPECREYLGSYRTAVALGRVAFLEPAAEPAAPPAELIAAILASRVIPRRASLDNADA